MVGNHHYTRVDTLELKELIYRKIGHQRAEKYFDQLKRFLGLKLNKSDFNKSCIRTIGRENISLHNRLIQSIIQNACGAKTPPPKPRKVDGINVKTPNGYQRNCLQSLYGDAFPQSPRKCRSPVNRDRKFRDRPSPLGPLGKSPSLTCEETVTITKEQQSLHSLCSRPPAGAISVEDGEEVEQFFSLRNWTPITAPLGVSVGAARKSFWCGNSNFGETCENNGELPDSISLTSRLEMKLAMEGLGISVDCANLLNNGLDVYLKRLIKPCIGLARSQSRDLCILGRGMNNPTMAGLNNQTMAVLNNGLLPAAKVSMLDFRVAMESNPHLLGQDWPVQLEKICHHASSE